MYWVNFSLQKKLKHFNVLFSTHLLKVLRKTNVISKGTELVEQISEDFWHPLSLATISFSPFYSFKLCN